MRIPAWPFLIPFLLAPKRPRTEPVDPFTPQALEALVDELVPEIERHAGRAFVRHPEVRLTDDPDFVTRVAEEQAWVLARVIPDNPWWVWARARSRDAALALLDDGIHRRPRNEWHVGDPDELRNVASTTSVWAGVMRIRRTAM